MAKPQKLLPVACLVLVECGGEKRSQKNNEDVFDHIAYLILIVRIFT